MDPTVLLLETRRPTADAHASNTISGPCERDSPGHGKATPIFLSPPTRAIAGHTTSTRLFSSNVTPHSGVVRSALGCVSMYNVKTFLTSSHTVLAQTFVGQGLGYPVPSKVQVRVRGTKNRLSADQTHSEVRCGLYTGRRRWARGGPHLMASMDRVESDLPFFCSYPSGSCMRSDGSSYSSHVGDIV